MNSDWPFALEMIIAGSVVLWAITDLVRTRRLLAANRARQESAEDGEER